MYQIPPVYSLQSKSYGRKGRTGAQRSASASDLRSRLTSASNSSLSKDRPRPPRQYFDPPFSAISSPYASSVAAPSVSSQDRQEWNLPPRQQERMTFETMNIPIVRLGPLYDGSADQIRDPGTGAAPEVFVPRIAVQVPFQSRKFSVYFIQHHPSTNMAPPNFPNGMTLYTIGFAALKYPALPPPPVNVPLGNQVGALQYQPPAAQNHQIAQIASQYLNALIEYQTSDEPTLHDRALPQYYFSTALCLLNFINNSPDVCNRIAAHPAIVNNIVERLLTPDFEDGMKGVQRLSGTHFPAATFDDEFGSLLQFLSTILLYVAEIGTLHPRIGELISKLHHWKHEYRNSSVRTISNAAERLVEQIQGMEPELVTKMRNMQEGNLVCGVSTCKVT
ncbi:hypothetical protein B7494_g5771 [Chlorociboria aeruginascens]|nr:hypothetical protein B7494_g5771 [Chlorociboria aeruginascens]